MFVSRFSAIVASSVLFLSVAGFAQHQVSNPAAPTNTKAGNTPSSDALSAIKGFQVPGELKVELWASEPMLKNPVAFNFDRQGRIYVCETYRLGHGVDDIRQIMDWLDEELASRTVDERLCEMKRHLGDKFSTYSEASEKIRLLEDRSGAGRADSSKIFAEGFNTPLDGIAAGVLPWKDKVWYADIPNLWVLQDTNRDGTADTRSSLLYGFAVRVGFLGHDLHGLTFGPDGKLYFSIGDRGSNVELPDGKHVGDAESGCVFRCNPDGSDFEVFASGLRNPQDLVFDEYGNLFTGDNNSDSGDEARWVYVVEGSDNGWRVGYQFMENPYSRGPFNAEKLWYPAFQGQAAYIVPPIANIASGPSGATYFPGTGLPEKYRGHFFLADFRGGPANSGIHTFTLAPRGAGFILTNAEHFIWGTLATDVKFSPGGGIYWSDWVDGWGMPDKGRIYRAHNMQVDENWLVKETAVLLASGMEKKSSAELVKLLAHADMRVRQEAQFELAGRGAASLPALTRVLGKSSTKMARIHAIWGIGQILRTGAGDAGEAARKSLLQALSDSDGEIRAQAAKTVGEVRIQAGLKRLVELIEDKEPRVRFFAAQSLGRLERREAVPALLDLLRQNGDSDPWLRHAAVLGLARINAVDALMAGAKDLSRSVRLGIVLALRRLQRAEIASFLKDQDPAIVLEAARAINDRPITGATEELAELASSPALARSDEALIRRVLNANFHFGTSQTAAALAGFAASTNAATAMRVEALEELANWEHPSGRDRVVGLWRPVAARRPAETAITALDPVFAKLVESSSPTQVRVATVHAVAALHMTNAGPAMSRLVSEKTNPGELRGEALKTLALLDDPALDEAIQAAATDPDEQLRKAAIPLAGLHPSSAALPLLRAALEQGTVSDQRAALTALGTLRTPDAQALLLANVKKLQRGEIRPELQLDVLEAADKQNDTEMKSALAAYRSAKPKGDGLAPFSEELYGGNAERGKKVFYERAEAQCVRCHRIHHHGGDVGPDLSTIGAQKDRRYLLESIVMPNKQIAPGFESVTVTLKNDETMAGVLKSENSRTLTINSPQTGLVTVQKAEIASRRKSLSPMPEGFAQMISKSDLRDLVEYLSSRK